MRQRTAPPVTVVVHRYALWRTALLALVLAVGLVLGAWGLVGRHWRRPGFLLRWDGQDWHWREREQVHEYRGRAIARIDLGDWMLLQLVAHDGRFAVWLPVQRAGLEPRWHALRCAVYSPYAAAKAGVAGMTRSLARELGSRGITVNCVAPGFIETDMTRALSEQQTQALMSQIPLGRLGRPEDIAHAVAYLASPQAGYITGAELHVNGGMFMN